MRYGDISISNSICVIILGVPRFENSASKKLKAATRNMIKTVISKALSILSKIRAIENLQYPMDKRMDLFAPIAAASASVAKLNEMEPSEHDIKIVGGIRPAKNSFQRS